MVARSNCRRVRWGPWAAALLALASGARADWIQTIGIGEKPALLGGAVTGRDGGPAALVLQPRRCGRFHLTPDLGRNARARLARARLLRRRRRPRHREHGRWHGRRGGAEPRPLPAARGAAEVRSASLRGPRRVRDRLRSAVRDHRQLERRRLPPLQQQQPVAVRPRAGSNAGGADLRAALGRRHARLGRVRQAAHRRVPGRRLRGRGRELCHRERRSRRSDDRRRRRRRPSLRSDRHEPSRRRALRLGLRSAGYTPRCAIACSTSWRSASRIARRRPSISRATSRCGSTLGGFGALPARSRSRYRLALEMPRHLSGGFAWTSRTGWPRGRSICSGPSGAPRAAWRSGARVARAGSRRAARGVRAGTSAGESGANAAVGDAIRSLVLDYDCATRSRSIAGVELHASSCVALLLRLHLRPERRAPRSRLDAISFSSDRHWAATGVAVRWGNAQGRSLALVTGFQAVVYESRRAGAGESRNLGGLATYQDADGDFATLGFTANRDPYVSARPDGRPITGPVGFSGFLWAAGLSLKGRF